MESSKACPSYKAVEGAYKIGDIDGYNQTTFHPPVKITKSEIIVLEKRGPIIETHSRLAGLCLQNTCNQWNNKNKRCGLAEHIISKDISNMNYSDHDNCPIKSTCRWIGEHGAMICNRCTHIMRYMQ